MTTHTTWTTYSPTWQTTWQPGAHRWASVYRDSTGAWRWVVLTEHGQEEWGLAASREAAADASIAAIDATVAPNPPQPRG